MSGIADKKNRESWMVEGGSCGVVKRCPVGGVLDELGNLVLVGSGAWGWSKCS